MPRTDQTDEELAASAQQGDRISLAALYDRYTPPIYRYCYAHVTHRQEAEDVTGEIMLRMVTHLATYRGTASFKTWLYGIARRAVADFWRGRYRLPETELPDTIGAPVTDEDPTDIGDAILAAERAKARQVFDRLPENYRTVLEHRFLHGRTLEETAKDMATTIGNVKVLQHRALKQAAAIAHQLPNV